MTQNTVQLRHDIDTNLAVLLLQLHCNYIVEQICNELDQKLRGGKRLVPSRIAVDKKCW